MNMLKANQSEMSWEKGYVTSRQTSPCSTADALYCMAICGSHTPKPRNRQQTTSERMCTMTSSVVTWTGRPATQNNG